MNQPRLVLLCLTALVVLVSVDAPARKPNVVFFLVDDFSAGALGVGGSDLHETPHIDKLYEAGMTFENGYAACTVCSSRRVAILTGKYPARTHLTDWIQGHKKPFEKLKVPNWNMKMEHSEVTLAEALRENGSRTGFFGTVDSRSRLCCFMVEITV